MEPPDPIPNSEVKLLSADDSVRSPHAKVGHCQDFIAKPRGFPRGFFYSLVPHLKGVTRIAAYSDGSVLDFNAAKSAITDKGF